MVVVVVHGGPSDSLQGVGDDGSRCGVCNEFSKSGVGKGVGWWQWWSWIRSRDLWVLSRTDPGDCGHGFIGWTSRFLSVWVGWWRWWSRVPNQMNRKVGLILEWCRKWFFCIEFGDSFSACVSYHKYRFLSSTSDVRTYLGLSFDFARWVGCGVCVDRLLEGVRSVRFFNLLCW